MVAPHNTQPTRVQPDMEFGIWVILRLVIPTGPIIIQLLLGLAGMYAPEFIQPTYLVLVFSLALVTATEYKSFKGIFWGSVVPAIAATALYTGYLLTISDAAKHHDALLTGFFLWAMLVFINVLRVLRDVVQRTSRAVGP